MATNTSTGGSFSTRTNNRPRHRGLFRDRPDMTPSHNFSPLATGRRSNFPTSTPAPNRFGIANANFSFNTTLNNQSRISNVSKIKDLPKIEPTPQKNELKEHAIRQVHTEKIVQFLVNTNFPKMINPKEFNPPTSLNLYMSIWEHFYKLIDSEFSFEQANNAADKTLNKTGFNATHMNNTTRVGRMSLAPNKRIDKVQVIRNKMEILGYPYPIPAKTTFNTISHRKTQSE